MPNLPAMGGLASSKSPESKMDIIQRADGGQSGLRSPLDQAKGSNRTEKLVKSIQNVQFPASTDRKPINKKETTQGQKRPLQGSAHQLHHTLIQAHLAK